ETAFRASAVIKNPSERLSGFVCGTADTQAFVVAHRFAGLTIEPDQGQRRAVREKRRNPADSTGLLFAIVERKVGFGCRKKLEDARDAEATFELVPHVSAKAVAAD